MPNIPLLSFNNGETTDNVDARSDVEKYSSSARTMQNMIPLVYGPAMERPGTKFIATAKNSPDAPRLLPFIFSDEIAYICELGDFYVRFYFDGAPLLTSGNPVETSTEFLLADLPQFQTTQLGDTMWLVHKAYAPSKLIRTTTTSFSVSRIVFESGPFRTRNDIEENDGVTMTSSVTTRGSNGLLTSSTPIFESGHAGALFQLAHEREVTEVTLKGPAAASNELDVVGTYSFVTTGRWRGTVNLERNEDGKGFQVFRSYTGLTTGAKNIRLDKTESLQRVKYKITATGIGGAGNISSDFGGTLQVFENLRFGIVRIDSIVSSTVAQITVLDALDATNGTDATVRWAEGAWSGVRGYPTSVHFYQGRIVYGGPDQTIWLSASDDFENFREGINDDDSFALKISTTNNIEWINSLEAIVIGTSGDEWQVSSNKLYTPLTPTNFSARRQTSRGNLNVQSIRADESVLFIDAPGRKIRELTFRGSEDRHVSPDLTIWAEHITEGGMTAMAFQKNPIPILWSRLSTGLLLSMSYEREQDVVAWARHPMGVSQETTSSTTNFSKGISNYEITYFTENGAVWGVPITADAVLTLRLSGSARDAGGGFVGLTAVGHPFSEGQVIQIAGAAGGGLTYNGLHTLTSGTTTNEMVFSATFNAETFDGTETVVQKIATGPAAGGAASQGRADQDIDGNMYVGMLGGVIKITDGKTVDFSWFFPSGHGALAVNGLELSSDGAFLYVYFSGQNTNLFKLNTSDASTVWKVSNFGGTESFDMAVDSDDNVYIPSRADTFESMAIFAAANGSKTNMSGSLARDGTGTMHHYVCVIDNDMVFTAGHEGVVIEGGFASDFAPETELFNIFIRDLDNTGGKGIAIGGIRNVGGSLNGTSSITSEKLLTHNGFIYVLTDGRIWKLNSRLEVLIDIDAPDDASGIYADLWDRIVIVTVDGAITERFHYFSEELVSEGTVDGFPGTMLENWDKTAIQRGVPLFYPGIFPLSTTTTNTQDAEGSVESIAVIPGNEEDEVWLSVSRPLGGTTGAFIEQMQPVAFGNQEDAIFADSCIINEAVNSATITGLDHLEDQEVVIWADGAVFPRQTVADGTITLSESVTKAVVGLPYKYILQPMRLDLTGQVATSKGSNKHITRLVISFKESLNVKYGKSTDEDDLKDIDFRTTEPYGSPPAMFTGDRSPTMDSGFTTEDPIFITSDDPAPCTVRAIIPRIVVTDRNQ